MIAIGILQIFGIGVAGTLAIVVVFRYLSTVLAVGAAVKQRVTVEVEPSSPADGRSIRAILWPAGGMVVEVERTDGSRFVPDGKTRLSAGDKLTVECVAASERDVTDYLYEIVGEPLGNG